MDKQMDAAEFPLVLVVDDDIIARSLGRAALEQGGYQVVEAPDGEEAIRAFEQFNPDIILMDVMMPEVNGFIACSRIRAMPGGMYTPVVMVTGLDDLASIDHAYQVGATDFITKPINYSLLKHRVQYMLRGKRIQDELVASEARLANAQRIAKLGHWEWEAGHDRMHWSDQVLKILGSTSTEATTYPGFLDRIHPDDRRMVEKVMTEALIRRTGYSLEHRILRPDRTLRTVYQEAEFVTDQAGKSMRLVGTLQDITERRRVEQQVQHLSYYDKVTGLPNRFLLKQQLAQALATARQRKHHLAVLTVDLDHFNRINDTLGFALGDELLQGVGQRLAKCLRNNPSKREEASDDPWDGLDGRKDAIAHIGGDEFVLVLTKIRKAEEAGVVARRIREVLASPFSLKGNEVCITPSIGISIYPDDSHDAENLLKESALALNHAKSEGRNSFKFYTASMDARASELLSMESHLRKALELNQFRLHYQPRIDVSRGERVVGMEALIRWEHPELGLVPPLRFIPIAEERGFIIPLGEWVLREACRQMVAWRSQGMPPLHVSVNLSAAQFNQQDLPAMLEEIMRDTGMDPGWLELEITESLLMNDVESTIARLNKIKDLGLRISIDDFGTGYSSLSYLKRFPISTLKIDRSFINEAPTNAGDKAIVTAVITLAHSLGLHVVAEGVEELDQLTLLKGLGCDEIQGYYYSRPLPPDAFAEWVLSRQPLANLKLVG
jgi:PAS domain S-box-containing protein